MLTGVRGAWKVGGARILDWSPTTPKEGGAWNVENSSPAKGEDGATGRLDDCQKSSFTGTGGVGVGWVRIEMLPKPGNALINWQTHHTHTETPQLVLFW